MADVKKVYEKIFNEFLIPAFPWIENIVIISDGLSDNKVFVDCYLATNDKTIRGVNAELLMGRLQRKMTGLTEYVGLPIRGWIRLYDEDKVVAFNPISY